MVWLEVETKVRLKDSEVKALRSRIQELADFDKKGKKVDDYFAVQQKTYPKKAFRIRRMKDRFEVTFKRPFKKYYTNYIVVKREFEFTLDGKERVDDFVELFKDLGIKEWVQKVKKNETYKYRKDRSLSIEINKVKHLGYFMEIEYLCQQKDVRKAQKKIMKLLEELGINLDQVDNTGYTKMLWKKNKRGVRRFMK